VKRYAWACAGDANAFFGLMLDNAANLVLLVGMLHGAYGFPASFALEYMIPGTAIGVLAGDLVFTAMAFRLAKRTGRPHVTAMPLGLDTPSTVGMVVFVLGPVYQDALRSGLDETLAATRAWHVGICSIVISGVFKVACAPFAAWVRRIVPRAGLLGSLTAVALVLISFLPLLEVFNYPLVGLVSLAVILTTLVAKIELPGRIPGALGALVAGGIVYYALRLAGAIDAEATPFAPGDALLPRGWLEAFGFQWTTAMGEAVRYLPFVLPFALTTVVGGIDCTESAAAAGDEFSTPWVIGVEGWCTILAGCCGGVIQSTPYIGHPAYKAMGGRAAYTLATALFIGSAGVLGYFGYLYAVIPKAAIFPILVFVGLEITAQSFHATPTRHYAAVAIACIPALAYLVTIYSDQFVAATQGTLVDLQQESHELTGGLDEFAEATSQHGLARNLQTMRMLAGGFVITSLIWSSGLAAIIDRRLAVASAFMAAGAVFSLFGVMHSPLAGSPLALPWALPQELPRAAAGQGPWHLAAGYAAMAGLLLVWHRVLRPVERTPTN
jgi:AGZA family xanthine/uracil permease-like MFS transporter